MRIHMPITKDKIKNHFHYSLWKYAVLIIAAVLFWNLLHTVTRYQTPGHMKMEFFAEGYQNEEQKRAAEGMMDSVHKSMMPHMEEVSYTLVTLDENYGAMQLTVWASAGEGDAYLLSRERFFQLAQSGAMLDLQPYVDEGELNMEGLSLMEGIVRDADTGERFLYGIPADSLTQLKDLGLVTEGGFLSILQMSENKQEAVVFLNYLLTHMGSADSD